MFNILQNIILYWTIYISLAWRWPMRYNFIFGKNKLKIAHEKVQSTVQLFFRAMIGCSFWVRIRSLPQWDTAMYVFFATSGIWAIYPFYLGSYLSHRWFSHAAWRSICVSTNAVLGMHMNVTWYLHSVLFDSNFQPSTLDSRRHSFGRHTSRSLLKQSSNSWFPTESSLFFLPSGTQSELYYFSLPSLLS